MQGTIERVDQEIQDRMDAVFLDDKGYIKLLSSKVFLEEDPSQFRLWCYRHAIYGVPTIELIAWLHSFIGVRRAIEIGAGNACLGLHLGIPSTDSYMQCCPLMRLHYGSLGQPVTEPPAAVYKYEAKKAVKTFQPDVVIASWVTQKFIPGVDKDETAQASVYGVDEMTLLRNVKCYIHIGNEDSHNEKRILAKPHRTFKFPWLLSRAASPEKNVIYVWG